MLEREVIRRFEARIQALADERVAAYAASPEFVALVEELKRKKREEMLAKCVAWIGCLGLGWGVCWGVLLLTYQPINKRKHRINEDVKAEREAILAEERERVEGDLAGKRAAKEAECERQRQEEERRKREAEEKARCV